MRPYTGCVCHWDVSILRRLPMRSLNRLQVLYQHLSQPCIDLNWCASGRSCRLTDAISYSLRTPGALLHTCCQVLACLDLMHCEPGSASMSRA